MVDFDGKKLKAAGQLLQNGSHYISILTYDNHSIYLAVLIGI